MILGVPWYYWLVLVVVFIATIILFIKASAASKARSERLKKEAAIWRRDYDLRQKYSVLTEEKLRECPDSELLHAVAMNIQVTLENANNMNEAFETLPIEKKYIYTLEYFDEDAKIGLSHFLKNNGAPLLPNVTGALKAIGAQDILVHVNTLYPMYDPDSEVSVDYEIISKTDEQFKEIYDSQDLYNKAATYIKVNKKIFL